jgi:hypothetical protein
MLEGSCLCGAIRYQVAGFILDCHACHCRACKKFSGTAHSTVMIGLASNLTWPSGADQLSFFEEAKPNPRAFCRRCGSRMPSVSNNGMVVIPAGSLDGDPAIPLSHHFYTKYNPSWEPKVAEPCYHETMPPEGFVPTWKDIGSRLDELGDDAVEFLQICDRTDGFRQWWGENVGELDSRLRELMNVAQARNDAGA